MKRYDKKNDDIDRREEDEEAFDANSREQSEKNYVLGGTMTNPWNNTKNPNWRNYVMKDGFRREKINDPQRVNEKNRVEDSNYNKQLLDKNDK